MSYSDTTSRSDPTLDDKNYRKLVQLVCFLRQLNPLHDSEDLDDDIDDDLESIPPSGALRKVEGLPEPKVELRQVLVDAIAFVASSERTAAHVVAVAVEELNEPMVESLDSRRSSMTSRYYRKGPTGLRFRLSMNGEIPESMLSELTEFGTILGQLDSRDHEETNAHKRVFDSIIQMKRRNLATLLRGGLGPPGLLSLFEDARRKLTASGSVQYPPYSNTLSISPEEYEKNGAYTPWTHERHMTAAWSYFEELDKLCRRSANRGKEKGHSQGSLKIEAVKAFISLAFEGRHSKCFRHLLTLGDKTASTKLYQTLRKLSRYWKCTLDLVKCARSRSLGRSFKNIEFCVIPRMRAKLLTASPHSGNELLTFLTSLGYHDGEVLKHYGSRYCRMDTEFGELQRRELYVHAEIALVHFYALHPELHPASEIGCSKYACFLCDLFIKHHPDFKIRATHKKVYVRWGLPDLEGLQIHNQSLSMKLQNAIQGTMRDIEKAVRTEFNSPVKRQPQDLLPESSSGVSETDTADSGTVVGGPVAESVAGSEDTAIDSFDPYSGTMKEKIMRQKGFGDMVRYLTTGDLESSLERVGINDISPRDYKLLEVGKCCRCGEETTDRCRECGGFSCGG